MRVRLSNGLALGYGVRGSGQAFVFLHPIGTRRALWDGVVDCLQDKGCCVAVDFRGHGESDTPPGAFTLAELAGDVIELMRIREMAKVVVVGCSMGGMVAQAVAARAPELVSAVVLAGTSHTQTAQSAEAMRRRGREAAAGMPPVVESTIDRWFPPAYRQARPDSVERVRQWLLGNDPVVFAWGWQAIAALDHTQHLRNIKAPVLLVRGSLDASTPAERMRAMQEVLGNASYAEMPEAGHLAPLENPEAFAGLVRAFVDSRASDPSK